jgi:hypothetical protein
MAIFWVKWLIVSVGSTVIANFLIQAIALLIEKVVLKSIGGSFISEISVIIYRALTGSFLGALLIGAFIGSGQWLVLRTQIPITSKYILATTLGWFFAGFFVFFNHIGAIGGTIVGLAQWVVLREFFSQSGWWVFANILGWGLAGYGYQAFVRLNSYTSFSLFDMIINRGLLINAGTTGISSAFTGLAIVLLLIYKRKA